MLYILFVKTFKYCLVLTFLGLTEFLNSTEIGECGDENSGRRIFDKIFIEKYFINKEKWLQQCPLPCMQKLFDFNYQMFHKNSIPASIGGKPSINAIKLFSSLTGVK